MNELEQIIRDIIRAVLKERGIEVVANFNAGDASTRIALSNGAPRELSRFERASLAMQQSAPSQQAVPSNTSAPVTVASNGFASSGANASSLNASSPGAFGNGAQSVPAPVITSQNAGTANANVTDASGVVSANLSANAAPQNAAPLARVLAAVCCGECLSENARVALNQLENSGFALSQPAEDELKKRAPREAMIAAHDVVLLPAVGDDDAAKMAAGIFDEPVTRTALAALASGVPVYIVLHAPYAEALRRGSPNLARMAENNRRALQTLGFNVVEANNLGDTLRARFASTRAAASIETRGNGVTFGANFRALNGGANGANAANYVASTRGSNTGSDGAMQNGAGRFLITAQDIDRAARSGEALNLSNAIITPLARDRARELNFHLGA